MTVAAVASLTEQARRLYPGVALCSVVALAGSFLAAHYDAPSLLFALLLGLGFTIQARDERVAPGVEFCARTVLRIGVALLGARIGLGQLQTVGAAPLLLVGTTVPLVLGASLLLGRWLRLPGFASLVAGAAVAICGVSAAIAVAAALPAGKVEERRLLGIVVSVTVLGTVGMILYPPLTQLLSFDAAHAGLFLGATIHDVAQAAGAGYLVSDLSGDVATVTKLLRVAALVPLILLLGLFLRRGDRKGVGLPVFLVGFAVLLGLNSGGALPAELRDVLVTASSACLLVTMAALGMRTSASGLLALGWRPIVHVVSLSLLLAAVAAGILRVVPA